MTKDRHALRLTLALGLASLAGCGSDEGGHSSESDAADAGSEVVLELFSWWKAPGEAEALSALISAHHARYPNVSIYNLAVSNEDAPYVMAERFGFKCTAKRTLDTTVDCRRDESITPDPVDLMQWNLGDVKRVWIDQGVKFTALDAVLDEENVVDQLLPEAREAVTVDGEIIALPVGIHRNNNLIYNRDVLDVAGVDPEGLETWEDFIAACDKVQTSGKTCLATGTQGWIMNILFGNVVAMTMGAQGYVDYYSGKSSADDPKLAEAVQNFDLLMRKYVGKTAELPGGWDEACAKLQDGKAAFYLHGDWAVGLLKARGWDSTNFGVMASPGSQGLFLFGVDGFLLPEGSMHGDAALEVIRTWSSPEALAAFSKAKGATPPRKDVDLTDDPLANGTYQDLLKAEYPLPENDRGVKFETLAEYVTGKKTVADILTEAKSVYAR
ncbi:MAG: ABC transporter substrate-binding protein [Myxococcales bacterium]